MPNDASRRPERRPIAIISALVLALSSGCGLRVTRDQPQFEDLEPHEKGAVEIVMQELQAFDAQVRQRTALDISAVVDRERINVSFEGIIFAANLGDEVVHVAVWDNLSDSQKDLVKTWFQLPDLATARQTYERFFYRYMAVSQGVKQYMYEALGVDWVFSNRSIFNVERDSARVALAHYAAIDPGKDMWFFLNAACNPILLRHGAKYGSTFGKKYLNENFRELVGDGKTPTGYMYYACRWIEMGREAASDLTFELDWIQQLRP